jgi:hypothetical protein
MLLARFEGLRPDTRDTTNAYKPNFLMWWTHLSLGKCVHAGLVVRATSFRSSIFSVFVIDTYQEFSNSETNFLFNFQCLQNCRLVKEPIGGARPQLLSQLVGKWPMAWHYSLRMCRIKWTNCVGNIILNLCLETFTATEFNEISSDRRPDFDAAVCPRKFHWLTFDNIFKMHGTITYLNSLIYGLFSSCVFNC